MAVVDKEYCEKQSSQTSDSSLHEEQIKEFSFPDLLEHEWLIFFCYHGDWNVVSAADVHMCQQFQLYYPAVVCCSYRLKTKMKIRTMMTLKNFQP